MSNLIAVVGARTVGIRSLLERSIETFLANLDAKPRTKETYRKALRVFQAWIVDKGYLKPAREHILEYRAYLQGKTLACLTVNVYLTAVRRFFAFLEGEKIYPNIAKGVKGLKRPKGHLRSDLTASEARMLIDSIKGKDLITLRDRTMINLMLHTGMRAIEVARALIEDIGKEQGANILRVCGKGEDAKARFVVLEEEAYQPIMAYLNARGTVEPSGPLFISHANRNKGKALTTRTIRRITNRWLKKANLKRKGISTHSLRHSACSIAIENGAPILSVQAMAGHSDVKTTMLYVHQRNRISAAAENYVKF